MPRDTNILDLLVDSVSDKRKRLVKRVLPPIVFDWILHRLQPDRRVETRIDTPVGTINLPLVEGDNLQRVEDNPRNEPLARLPNGGFEPVFVRDLVQNLDSQTVYYDIGSAKGYFVEVARKAGVPCEQIHLFEPSAHSTRLHSRYNEAHVNATLVGEESRDGVVSLDRYAENHAEPDVVKVDVEGGEFDVVRGLGSLRPILYIEIHPLLLDAADSVPNLVNQLSDLGYDVAWADHRQAEGTWYDTEATPLPYPSTLSTNSNGPYMLRAIP